MFLFKVVNFQDKKKISLHCGNLQTKIKSHFRKFCFSFCEVPLHSVVNTWLCSFSMCTVVIITDDNVARLMPQLNMHKYAVACVIPHIEALESYAIILH